MIQYKCVTEYGRVITGAAPMKLYPDGTPYFTERPVAPVYRIMVQQESFTEFVAAMALVDAWSASGYMHPKCELILPFFPGARQDRLNTAGDVLFTARYVADMINSLPFGRVTLFDPHSDVTPALVERCDVITAADCINPPAGKYAAVIAPDAGAVKRASAVAKKLGVPVLQAWKNRDVATGKISSFGMQTGCNELDRVLVVDDICDGGGTFLGLRPHIAAREAHLFITHGLFTQGTEALLERYHHVYTTDSVVGNAPGVIKVFPCQNKFNEAL